LKGLARDAGEFSDAAGEREMAKKCGSPTRDAGDLVGLQFFSSATTCYALRGHDRKLLEIMSRLDASSSASDWTTFGTAYRPVLYKQHPSTCSRTHTTNILAEKRLR